MEVSEVYEWLVGEVHPGRVYVYGGSYGGHVAARLMGKYELRKVVLQAPAVLAEVEDGIKMGNFKEIEAKAIREPSIDKVTEVIKTITAGFSGKLMIMRSENDELVPRAAVDAWRTVFPGSDYVIVKNALHSIRKSSKEAQNQWINELSRFFINE
jgi:dipeptidyl aminopeptidase/acylaminoacyl peptidase